MQPLVAVYNLRALVRLVHGAALAQAARQALASDQTRLKDHALLNSLLQNLAGQPTGPAVREDIARLANAQRSAATRYMSQVLIATRQGAAVLDRTIEMLESHRTDSLAHIRSIFTDMAKADPALDRKLGNWIMRMAAVRTARSLMVPVPGKTGNVAELVATTASLALIFSPSKAGPADSPQGREPNAVAFDSSKEAARHFSLRTGHWLEAGYNQLLQDASAKVAELSQLVLRQLPDFKRRPLSQGTDKGISAFAGMDTKIVRSAARIVPVVYAVPDIFEAVKDFRADLELSK